MADDESATSARGVHVRSDRRDRIAAHDRQHRHHQQADRTVEVKEIGYSRCREHRAWIAEIGPRGDDVVEVGKDVVGVRDRHGLDVDVGYRGFRVGA